MDRRSAPYFSQVGSAGDTFRKDARRRVVSEIAGMVTGGDDGSGLGTAAVDTEKEGRGGGKRHGAARLIGTAEGWCGVGR